MIKVLIVDDEFIMRQGLKYMINWENEGYEIVGEAANGQEAMELTHKLCPDIIICDIVMPILDGVDFSQLVHESYPDIQLIILSGYDKFEFVKNTLINGAVDYILKPTLTPDELRNALKKAKEKIPDYKAHDTDSASSLARKLERYLIGQDKELPTDELSQFFKYPNYRMYAVNIKKENNTRTSMTKMLYNKIEREAQNFNELLYVRIFLHEEVACLIINYDNDYEANTIEQIKNLNDKLYAICDNILGIVSNRFTSFRQINEIYQKDILPNVDKGFYYFDRKLLMAERDLINPIIDKRERFDFTEYNHLLGGRQYDKAAKLLSDYSHKKILSQTDVYGLKNQMKNMVYHFLEHLELTENELDEKRYKYFQSINQATNAEEYEKCVELILNELLTLSAYKSNDDERMEKLIDYISKNYMYDLKLTDLSEEFNLNYYYLSSYFNQEMKEGFNDYLNRVRIDKACKLLKESRTSIAEVGSQVGYSDHSYFCRVFKKITGRTPSEWKRL